MSLDDEWPETEEATRGGCFVVETGGLKKRLCSTRKATITNGRLGGLDVPPTESWTPKGVSRAFCFLAALQVGPDADLDGPGRLQLDCQDYPEIGANQSGLETHAGQSCDEVSADEGSQTLESGTEEGGCG